MVSKKLSQLLLFIYLLLLIWILLFKLSLSFSDVATSLKYPVRSLNLIPFQESVIVNGKIALNEIFLNAVVFMPLGMLLGISAKGLSFIKKLVFFLIFSLFIEGLQFILGIGATDVTDIIMNFSGGFLGLCIYQGLKQVIPEAKLDRRLIIIGTLIEVLCFGMLLLLLFVNR